MAPPIQKSYADTPYGQLHYRHVVPVVSDTRKTTIVMFHKSASSSASYESLMSLLVAKGYPCYALDMPGFGGSFDPLPEDIEDIATKGTRWYVDVFISALENIGVIKQTTKIHLIGHHSGASLAPELATVYPEMVESITLIGTAVMDADERAKMKEKYFAPFNKPTKDGSHLIKTWTYLSTMGVGDNIDMVQREAIDHIRAWKGRNQIYGAVWDQDLGQFLDKVRCPIMFICAKDDVLWEYQEKAKQKWPDAMYAECRGANFSLDLDTEAILKAWWSFVGA